VISVDLPDGRRIAVEDDGDPDGYPVFLLHGIPGSRTGPKPKLGSRLSVLPSIQDDLIDADQWVLSHYDIVKELGVSYAEAYRDGVWGHLDDMIALTHPPGRLGLRAG
jgi:hypothetical protein